MIGNLKKTFRPRVNTAAIAGRETLILGAAATQINFVRMFMYTNMSNV